MLVSACASPTQPRLAQARAHLRPFDALALLLLLATSAATWLPRSRLPYLQTALGLGPVQCLWQAQDSEVLLLVAQHLMCKAGCILLNGRVAQW